MKLSIVTSKELTSDPNLPQYAKCPRRIGDGEPAHQFAKAYLQQQYFEFFEWGVETLILAI